MSSKGTVFHVIESLGRGGAETALVSGLPALAQLGWRVEAVALRTPVDLMEDLALRGIPVSVGPGALVRRLLETRGSRRLLHSHLYFANLLSRLSAFVFRVPIVTTLHNPDYGSEGAGRWGMRLRLDKALLQLRRPKYLSVSEAVRLDYAASLGIESLLCPNPVDSFWLAALPSREEARARLGIGDRPLVFACGRLHIQKGFDILARAATKLDGVTTVIAGAGAQAAELEALGSVRLVGSLRRDAIRDWIVASDVVAVPSRWESFGIFALEAMACGAAIVGSDIPGLRDTLGAGARLVKPDNVDSLVDGVATLLKNRDEGRRLGKIAARRARDFTPESWARNHDAIYESVFCAQDEQQPLVGSGVVG